MEGRGQDPFMLACAAASSVTCTDDTVAIFALILGFHRFCSFDHADINGEASRAVDELWYAYQGRIYIIFGSDLIQAFSLISGDLLEVRRR